MLDKIIRFSIHNKFIVGLMVLTLIGVGVYATMNLPMDTQPDITNNQVQIITSAPTLATQEVEQFITYPIEQAVKPIPNINELRSISRFGLSVVTVVFEEKVDPYWARNQISERLKETEDLIPKNVGKPELAPLSTGLGEIYQYVVYPKEGYEEQYTAMDLRTIQDWIIKPQLTGIAGVAEINTLGGELKQYEIAIQPHLLKSMNTSIAEIFEALENNNENTGGAYIDKKPYAYFIRSIGMVNTIEDIEKIVVKNNQGIPVLIRDVAEVRVGSSIRYGAVTKDGLGEEVSGMVMMLKGENSKAVVERVKERMVQIEKTLPEGVAIESFMDRTKLVDKTINTIKTNLIEGALIVIFVLVLFLGNLRAGLIVASVIPLALLFAISLMYFFGVSGNLMSLGAIDFGLIVDGTVIIVEAVVHRLHLGKKRKLTKIEMNTLVYEAASKIRTSASFGEIIILIVYLPILSLSGIEGKMFGPMAMTVSFAILGAFILSLTYVPMMSSLVLKKESGKSKLNLSDRITAYIYSLYKPLLERALRVKKTILLTAFVLFLGAIALFSTLGGEFIPTLDEGDLATHVIIASGSSLSQEIETTLKAEKMLKERFPEIKMIVTKIGSAEIPTDPMPMEAGDMIIMLKDKKEWTSAKTKEELIEKMEATLHEIPGITTEFSQPIQMRFNELMTGVRSDVAIKIFGEDMNVLASKGQEVTELIQDIPGVISPKPERITGLPQISIRYDKDKLALYGLNIGAVSAIVRTGFAGESTGFIYEGEKRFDLVVRLDEAYRKDINNLKNMFVPLPNGGQITLAQIADIDYEDGPMQITREDGRRRIVVGFNVRNRDVKSVVQDIQERLNDQLSLPSGYYITYGGQFQNLIEATQRLSIAVPIALGLIFVLLYFTFKSVKQSIMIFTAIPLSAIGGVIALWLRDMPFSISAGVGFIALFGVAVLNGIVLIAKFNNLKEEGMTSIYERIIEGTKVRLRPVLLTALVASLGFLPMALSQGAGAEVQKPLATVVIGGLISATLLTLIVLPILYYYEERGVFKRSSNTNKVVATLLLLVTVGIGLQAQEHPSLSLERVVELGMQNNLRLQAERSQVESERILQKSAFEIPKTDFSASYGQLNTTAERDFSLTVSQSISPFTFAPRKKMLQKSYEQSVLSEEELKILLQYEIRNTWQRWLYGISKTKILNRQIELLQTFVQSAKIRYETGESTFTEYTIAQVKLQELEVLLQQNATDIQNDITYLETLINQRVDFIPEETELTVLFNGANEETSLLQNNKYLQSLKATEQHEATYSLERSMLLPDISLGYTGESQAGYETLDGIEKYYGKSLRLNSFSIGIQIPILFGSQQTKIKAQRLQIEKSKLESEYVLKQLNQQLAQQQQQIATKEKLINYYVSEALPNAHLLQEHADVAYTNGAISYVEYLQSSGTALDVQMKYLEVVLDYNLTMNQLHFLINP